VDTIQPLPLSVQSDLLIDATPDDNVSEVKLR
jgi:hypothetical protein